MKPNALIAAALRITSTSGILPIKTQKQHYGRFANAIMLLLIFSTDYKLLPLAMLSQQEYT